MRPTALATDMAGRLDHEIYRDLTSLHDNEEERGLVATAGELIERPDKVRGSNADLERPYTAYSLIEISPL